MPTHTLLPMRRDCLLRQWLDTAAARLDGCFLTGEVSVCPVRYLPEHQTITVSQQENAHLFGVYVQVTERFRGTDCFEWRWLHDFATQQSAQACAENLRQWFANVRLGNRFNARTTGQSTPQHSKTTRSGHIVTAGRIVAVKVKQSPILLTHPIRTAYCPHSEPFSKTGFTHWPDRKNFSFPDRPDC